MKKLESTMKNMTLVLTSISVIAAALMGFMYEQTKEPIAAIQAQKLKEGVALAVPNTASYDEKTDGDYTFFYTKDAAGKPLGVAVRMAVQGFSPALTILVGFDYDGNILGYNILSHSETPGLGSKVTTWFQEGGKGNIIGRNPGEKSLVVAKDGGDVDGITASTITSRAFLTAINKGYEAALGKNVNGHTGATDTSADSQPAPQQTAATGSTAVAPATDEQNQQNDLTH